MSRFKLAAVTRTRLAVLVAACALALAAPAQAATPTASLKPPASGDLSLAHLVFSTKGGSKTPKLALTNKSKLAKSLTVIGGVKKLKKNSYLASVAVLNRKPASGKLVASASAGPALKLTLPTGMTFSKFTSKVIAKNLLANSAAPKFCGAVPADFAYVAKKPLAGSLLPQFSADTREYVRAGYKMDCPGGYSEEELGYLAASLRGESINQPSPGSGGDEGDEEEEEDGDGGIKTSPTLTGSGTVFTESPTTFRYEITFNEPVNAYDFTVSGSSIDCPNQYDDAKCGSLGNSASGGGVTIPCRGGYYTYEFGCATPGSHSSPPAQVPANNTITGRFTINAGSVQQGKVTVVAYGSSGKSQPITLSVQP